MKENNCNEPLIKRVKSKHPRTPGGKTHLSKEDESAIEKALVIAAGWGYPFEHGDVKVFFNLITIGRVGTSYKDVEKEFGIPAATISRKVKAKHPRVPGGKTYLSKEDESAIEEAMVFAAEWGYPFEHGDVKVFSILS
ncbi:hypothetical protein JTB14_030483 [Gonioctena quinquepunctata]|nr:hypothetical protein JTB14_030483 [Gonioctena quinquepunctata]